MKLPCKHCGEMPVMRSYSYRSEIMVYYKCSGCNRHAENSCNGKTLALKYWNEENAR